MCCRIHNQLIKKEQMLVKKLYIIVFFIWLGVDVQAQELKLRYSSPAKEWEEALPIGNGRLGAMIYGGTAIEEVQFNEETLWTGSPRDYNKYGAHLYLDRIRGLLNQGLQAEAEQLAMQEFMGTKSASADNSEWLDQVAVARTQKNGPGRLKFDDKHWKTLSVPAYEGWETVGLEGLNGAVWFRKEIYLSEEDLHGAHWILDLNKIKDIDYTYINGTLLGTMSNGEERRRYKVPVGVLRKGKNVLAVQVINLQGKGGILGYKDTAEHICLTNATRKISLNGQWKYFVQDAKAPKVGTYQAAYQAFGSLRIVFGHQQVSDYVRTLDLENSEVKVSYKHQGVRYQRSYLASYPDNVIASRFEADQHHKISFDLSFVTKHTEHDIRFVDKQTLALKVHVKDGALYGESLVYLRLEGGKIKQSGKSIRVEGADKAYLYLVAATNFVNYNDVSADAFGLAKRTLAAVAVKDFEEVRNTHREDYKVLFDRFSIDLGQQSQADTDKRLARFEEKVDPSLAALYVQFGRYLLISSSRESTQPANLQGIWNHLLEPSWDSKYTTNINVEMNYWPAEVLNLSTLHDPLFRLLREVSEKGKVTAKEYYNARGWVLHHNTDIWRGTAPINNSNHGIWPTGGAWLIHHVWENYLFNKNIQVLQQHYAIIKGATLFFKDFLVIHPKTGELVSSPSNSPEHGGLVAGPAMDHQLIRNLFRIFITTSDLLDTDASLRDSIGVMLPLLASDKVGKYGQLQEWMEDIDDPANKHRHISHLWALHPGSEINWDTTPGLVDAARQSLIMRGDEGTGWSLAWKINFWARIRDAEHSLKLVKMLLRPADRSGGSYPNLFDAHPPFQIDGNFGGAAGIVEMLVQSHTRFIEILPALPADFVQGDIKGIKARGNFELDLDWKDNTLNKVLVRAYSGGKLLLKYQDDTIEMETEAGKVYTFDKNLQLLRND